MFDLADADPVPVVLDWLRGHPDMLALCEHGPDQVGGLSEDPWPHLVVGAGPGGTINLNGGPHELEVTLVAWSSPTGYPGSAALWRFAARALSVVGRLPDEQVVRPGDPVVSRVRPSGAFVEAPTTAGHTTISTGVFVTIRPPKPPL